MSDNIIHEKRIAYKGFNSKLQCQPDEYQDPFQYEIGKSYEESDIVIGERGFHAYLNPIKIFSQYEYALCSRYCEVEVEDYIVNGDLVCAKKITILRELTIAELLDIPTIITPREFIMRMNHYQHMAQITKINPYAKISMGNLGCDAINDSHGGIAYCANPCETAISTGAYGASVSEQKMSLAISTSTYSLAECRDAKSIACSLGYGGIAKGEKGSWIVLACYEELPNIVAPFKRVPKQISSVKAFYVDGEKVKANTYYTLWNDELVEVISK